jgi:glycogen(starch) synthase
MKGCVDENAQKQIHMSFHSLMFGWEYPPLHSGGLGVACHGMVRGLLKHGMRVTLVLPSNATDDQHNLEVRGPGHDVPQIRYVKSALQPYEGTEEYMERMQRESNGEPVTDLYGPDLGEAVERFTQMSVDITRDVNADVIHCHDWMTYDAGIHAAKHHNIPLVAHVHATELDRTDFRPNTWIADKERFGLMKADKVIAVSNYTKNLLVNQYGIPADRIAVVHNGHDAPQIRHDDTIVSAQRRKTPLVLFLGRLTTQKNPWQFLEAAKMVNEVRPDVQFVMAGDGPMMTELIDRTCELGLADRVIFTGKVNRKEVDNIYRSASCFVMPSLSEPFGLVALEAIGHGVPVILSRQSGAAEVIEHCFKADFWDTDRFADCILTVLREQPLAEQLMAEAPHILKRLSWFNQANAIQTVYHDLLQS